LAIVYGIVLSIIHRTVNEALTSLVGIYVAWCYLRFFQTRSDGNAIGDTADSFALTTFFPAVLKPIVAFIGSKCFNAATAIGIIKQQKLVMQSNGAILPVSVSKNAVSSPSTGDSSDFTGNNSNAGSAPKISPNPTVAQHRRELANELIEKELLANIKKAEQQQALLITSAANSSSASSSTTASVAATSETQQHDDNKQ